MKCAVCNTVTGTLFDPFRNLRNSNYKCNCGADFSNIKQLDRQNKKGTFTWVSLIKLLLR